MADRLRSVLVICDGLRASFLSPERTPNLMALGAASTRFTGYRSVFPSVTRVCSATIATGCYPAKHGLQGNTVALDEGDGLRARSVGDPDFRDRMRRALGRLLARPVTAELLSERGGAIIFSNVSPGAAYFHDPECRGWVYHRAGSFAPGGRPVSDADELRVTPDDAGDVAMTERFCREVLGERRPAHAVLWLCQPDKSGHRRGLGHPDYWRSLAVADRCVGQVAARLAADDPDFERTLLIVGSDHGMETIRRLVPVADELVAAGLKASAESTDVVVAPNGTAALIYFSEAARERIGRVADFVRSRDWADTVHVGEALAPFGQAAAHGLAVMVSMRHSAEPNAHGVPGLADAVLDPDNDGTGVGGAQHGGLGPNEQSPFLLVRGPGFAAVRDDRRPATLVDIAPTILAHHRVPLGGLDLDGRPLSGE